MHSFAEQVRNAAETCVASALYPVGDARLLLQVEGPGHLWTVRTSVAALDTAFRSLAAQGLARYGADRYAQELQPLLSYLRHRVDQHLQAGRP
jgi:hypothetical protein